ncbi:Holliday junction resolvase RecU [Mycoplasmopsis adleri]|uniref:Holliday junction resolvase RecU n=1 Tax=Mycoplasmopsis adleri TaxID=51362 RepID=UPI0038731BFA
MLLEEIINHTILYYYENEIAYIEKKGLPIKFQGTNFQNNKLFLEKAFIYKKSTVDYTGCFKGKFIAFEAKTTNENHLPRSNIPEHQINYLKLISKNGGEAFFIIFFNLYNEFYLVKYDQIKDYIHKQSITYEEIKKIGELLPLAFPGIIDFLTILE